MKPLASVLRNMTFCPFYVDCETQLPNTTSACALQIQPVRHTKSFKTFLQTPADTQHARGSQGKDHHGCISTPPSTTPHPLQGLPPLHRPTTTPIPFHGRNVFHPPFAFVVLRPPSFPRTTRPPAQPRTMRGPHSPRLGDRRRTLRFSRGGGLCGSKNCPAHRQQRQLRHASQSRGEKFLPRHRGLLRQFEP